MRTFSEIIINNMLIIPILIITAHLIEPLLFLNYIGTGSVLIYRNKESSLNYYQITIYDTC